MIDPVSFLSFFSYDILRKFQTERKIHENKPGGVKAEVDWSGPTMNYIDSQLDKPMSSNTVYN